MFAYRVSIQLRTLYSYVYAYNLYNYEGYSIKVADLNFQIANMNCQTFNPEVIRGAEMVHLELLKMLCDYVDSCRHEVYLAFLALKEEVNK